MLDEPLILVTQANKYNGDIWRGEGMYVGEGMRQGIVMCIEEANRGVSSMI